ncbi:MAG: CRISPR system precrRNA processing endoribonuclease RAMP protein Cas6 [Armatimonadetes bacterium]|nr:CRISPR system precrRNA processing endoribonuclease RAMP protein Cas6 [Armatimonadota bacterium]
MVGQTGWAIYQGEFDTLWPILKWAHALGAGKEAAIGCGRMALTCLR